MTATPWADDGAVILLRVLLSPKADEAVQWMDLAACREIGSDEWFPERGGSSAAAKAVCMSCPVRNQCLEYALENDIPHGIFGGLSYRQRRALRRSRRRSAA